MNVNASKPIPVNNMMYAIIIGLSSTLGASTIHKKVQS
jgi:hypothetical protein